MNIIFIGHDISYVRFYAALESAMRERSHLNSLHVYFRPSAFLYAKFFLSLRAVSPFIRRFFYGSSFKLQSQRMPIDLKFYQSVNNFSNQQFELLFEMYFKFFKSLLSHSQVDVAILPGEYRLFEQAAIKALKDFDNPPKIIYFEAGPPGYIYFDTRGVNANASFVLTGKNNLITSASPDSFLFKRQIQKPSQVILKGLMAVDIFWLFLTKLLRGLNDLTEYWKALNNRISFAVERRSSKLVRLDNLSSIHYIIFISQVQNDINHTHFGISNLELEKYLRKLLTDNKTLRLLWRDHPLESSDLVLNNLMSTFSDRVFCDAKRSLTEVISLAEGVVTVNSNGGLESLAAGIPVRILGKSYFSSLKGVYSNDEDFIEHCKKIRSFGPDESLKDDCDRFLKECFIPIDYRNGNFENSYLAANLIFSYANNKS